MNFEEQWKKMYNLLENYYKKNNHTEVPREFKTLNGYEYDENGLNLGDWCMNQRQKYTEGTLKPERIQKLKEVNFNLENNKHESLWNKMYNLLVIFYKYNKHTEVHIKFKTTNGYEYDEKGPNLGVWCMHQRDYYNEGTLSQERIKKLEAINFRFKNNKRELLWDKMYNLLAIYYKQNKHTNIIASFKTKDGVTYDEEGYNLGYWCNHQRQEYKKNKLSTEKIERLKLLNFNFSVRKEHKDSKYNLCNLYGIEYDKYEILKSTSYQELYAKIMLLKDHNQPLIIDDNLHEIFYMSNENMILKYMISKEDMIMNYYQKRKAK